MISLFQELLKKKNIYRQQKIKEKFNEEQGHWSLFLKQTLVALVN